MTLFSTKQGSYFGGRHLGLIFAGLLVGLLLGSCEVAESVPERSFGLVIPIYNGAGLEAAIKTLNPHLRTNDRFMLVSGNSSGDIDVPWLNEAAHMLRAAYPKTPIYAATSGLKNIEAASNVSALIEAVVYVYEPNFPNQPEFSWDFGTTLGLFAEAGVRIRGSGLIAIGKPTGRPILQSSLQSYAWNYGELAQTVDELFIQTQTYCKESPAAFAAALDTLITQYQAADTARVLTHSFTHTWVPQVTVDPSAPNGTSVVQARACLEEAKKRGLSGAVLWWSPTFVEQAVAFIASLNADAALGR